MLVGLGKLACWCSWRNGGRIAFTDIYPHALGLYLDRGQHSTPRRSLVVLVFDDTRHTCSQVPLARHMRVGAQLAVTLP